MNKDRRDKINEVIHALEDNKNTIETAAGEERDEFESLSEKAQESDKGQLIDQAAANLEEALDKFDELVKLLEEARG